MKLYLEEGTGSACWVPGFQAIPEGTVTSGCVEKEPVRRGPLDESGGPASPRVLRRRVNPAKTPEGVYATEGLLKYQMHVIDRPVDSSSLCLESKSLGQKDETGGLE